jgi:hypothetical protein
MRRSSSSRSVRRPMRCSTSARKSSSTGTMAGSMGSATGSRAGRGGRARTMTGAGFGATGAAAAGSRRAAGCSRGASMHEHERVNDTPASARQRRNTARSLEPDRGSGVTRWRKSRTRHTRAVRAISDGEHRCNCKRRRAPRRRRTRQPHAARLPASRAGAIDV